MTCRTWDEGIETGIDAIDVEHRLQVTLVNALEELLRAGNDPSLASRTMTQLVEFTSVHFLSEELMMKLHSYPQAEAHKAEHARLLRQVTELQQRIEAHAPAEALAAIPDLHSWLAAHIKGMDQAFARWCTKRGLSA